MNSITISGYRPAYMEAILFAARKMHKIAVFDTIVGIM